MRFLGALITSASAKGFDLTPDLILTDFESGFQNAMSISFPNIVLQGCFFHFSQCIWRQIQQHYEIAKKYREDEEFALHLRQLGALAFVPVSDLVSAFDTLMETSFFTTNDVLLAPLVDYFEDVWIGRPQRGRRRAPMFPHQTWNTHQATMDSDARTNNSVEGWHRRFSVLVGAHHPSFWKFVEKIKNEQSHTEHYLNQLESGVPSQSKRKKYKDLDKRILNIVEKYSSIPLTTYLIGIAQNLSFSV
jgi:hypothetical protein